VRNEFPRVADESSVPVHHPFAAVPHAPDHRASPRPRAEVARNSAHARKISRRQAQMIPATNKIPGGTPRG